MCRYCDKFTGDTRNREDRAKVDLFLGGDNRYELFVMHSIDDEYDCFLTVLDNKDCNSVVSIKINFCPVCGKKLVGQSNPEGIHPAFEKRDNKKSQTEAIRDYLLQGHSIGVMDALELFGCFCLGARIADLKKMGMNIESEIRKDEGTGKRYSRYWVESIA